MHPDIGVIILPEPIGPAALESAMQDHVLIKPVSVWEGDAIRRTLIDVEGAANFLLLKWPKAFMDTACHRKAQIAALDALGGHGTAATFREAFVAAADEAGIIAGGNGGAGPGVSRARRVPRGFSEEAEAGLAPAAVRPRTIDMPG